MFDRVFRTNAAEIHARFISSAGCREMEGKEKMGKKLALAVVQVWSDSGSSAGIPEMQAAAELLREILHFYSVSCEEEEEAVKSTNTNQIKFDSYSANSEPKLFHYTLHIEQV